MSCSCCLNDFSEVQRPFDPFLFRSRPSWAKVGDKWGPTPYLPSAVDALMDWSRLVWLVGSNSHRILRPPLVVPTDGIEATVACVERMRALTFEQGARFHGFGYRYLDSPAALPPAAWPDAIRRMGLHDLTPVILESGPGRVIGFDGLHWNAEGHQAVGIAIRIRLAEYP